MGSRWAVFLSLGLPIVLSVGCGGRASNLPELVPVDGTVTLDGKPLSGAKVQFTPVGSTRGSGARGSTDENGKYELRARHGGSGAPVGEYRVVIVKLDESPDPDGAAGADSVPAAAEPGGILPARYSIDSKTTLTATVPEGGGSIDFMLTSAP